MLHFDDELVPKVSMFKVTDIDGHPVAVTAVDTKDSKAIAATPAKPLAPGLYTVSWTAASTEDGHPMSGKFSFTVK
jgi:methionine-rich copper-binding protein CopC